MRPNPDPRTGLYKLDAGRLMGATWDWWIPDERTALAWHPFKADHVRSEHKWSRRLGADE